MMGQDTQNITTNKIGRNLGKILVIEGGDIGWIFQFEGIGWKVDGAINI